jgi:rRNA-processing protein FCF1
MTEDIKTLFARYQKAGILVDTNILLLYAVGLANKKRIPLFKRTRQFSIKDFDLLDQILRAFQKVVTTPNILTEVNSLANQLGEPERSQCLGLFAKIICQMEEQHHPSRHIAQFSEFPKFGLTDCSILHLSREGYLVLTDDFRLSMYLQNQGIDTVNFNNLRFLV